MADEPFDVEPPIPNTVKRAEALNDIPTIPPLSVNVNIENLPERFNAFMDGVAQYLEEYDDEYPDWLVEELPDLLNAYQAFLVDDDIEVYTKAVNGFCDLTQQKMRQEGIENVMVAAREFDKEPEQLLKDLYQNVEEFRLMNLVSAKHGQQYWFEDYEFDRLSASIEDLRMEKQINLAALRKDFFNDIAKPLFVNHAVDRIVSISTDYVNKTENFAFGHFVALAQFYGSATILRKLFQNAEKQRQEIVSLIQRSELSGLAVDLADITPDDSVSGYKAQMVFLAYVLSAEEEFKTLLDPLIPADKTPKQRQAAVFNVLNKDYVMERDADALFERGRAPMLYRLNYLLELTQGSPEQAENYKNSKLYRDGFNVVNDLVGSDNKIILAVFAQRAIQVYMEMLIQDVADDVGPKDEAGVVVGELQVLQTVMIFHGIYEDPIYFDPEFLNPETNGERFNLMITENIKMRLGDRAMDLKLFREDAEAPEDEKIGFWVEVILGAGTVAGVALSIFGLSGVQNATKSVWKFIKTHVSLRRVLLAVGITALVYFGVWVLATEEDINTQGRLATIVYDTQVYWAKYTRDVVVPIFTLTRPAKTADGTEIEVFQLNRTDYVNSAFTVMNFTLFIKFATDLLTACRNSSGNPTEQTNAKQKSIAVSKAAGGWVKTMYNSSFDGVRAIMYAGYAVLLPNVFNAIRLGIVKLVGDGLVDGVSSLMLTLGQWQGPGGVIVKNLQETVIGQVLDLFGYVYPATRLVAYFGIPLVAVGIWASNAYGGNRQAKRLLTIVGLQVALSLAASAVMNRDPLFGNVNLDVDPQRLEYGPNQELLLNRAVSIGKLAVAQSASIFALSYSAITFAQTIAEQLDRSLGGNPSRFAKSVNEALDATILVRLRQFRDQGDVDDQLDMNSNVQSPTWVEEANQAALTSVATRYGNSERLRQHLSKTYQTTLEEIKQAQQEFVSQ
ncbi:MAG: hypothetical protein CMP20_01640 [Rickettsiales bacterium]|nr:hypothetical protein [Rickettsiales bacterium]